MADKRVEQIRWEIALLKFLMVSFFAVLGGSIGILIAYTSAGTQVVAGLLGLPLSYLLVRIILTQMLVIDRLVDSIEEEKSWLSLRYLHLSAS